LPSTLKVSTDADWTQTQPVVSDTQIVFTALPKDIGYDWHVETTVTPTQITSQVVTGR